MSKIAIELFSGSCVVAETLRANGWEVLTIDINKSYQADVKTDIAGLNINDLPKKFRNPQLVWASPPCTTFSVLRIGHNWRDVMGLPMARNTRAAVGVYLVYKTLSLIHDLKPKYWFIENPVGKLRSMPFMKCLHRKTVTYCQYGERVRKPTDIWTNHITWTPKPMCSNGDTCHIASPRGSDAANKAGKNNAFERAKVPVSLIQEICDSLLNVDMSQSTLQIEVVGDE